MILEIVSYGHPALRAKGKEVGSIDDRIRKLAADMIDTMHEAEGVGLAAQQVAVPLQLCVLDVRDVPDRPSKMWIAGKPVNPGDHMPMVLINPRVEQSGNIETGIEGCLSFPGITADVDRPGRVRVTAMDLDGNEVEFEATGLLSRAVQHEHDHLHGILFIDRLNEPERKRVTPSVHKLVGSLLG
jgi:peptide deformylase